jgi:hypothetical protein
MPIDWNKIGESATLMAPTALVSAWIGARVTNYLNRAKPQVSITGFRKAKGSDLLDSRIIIPPSLSAKLNENSWTPNLHGKVNAANLMALVNKLEQSRLEAKAAIEFVKNQIDKLPSLQTGTDEQKIAFLVKITDAEQRIVDASLTGALVRQELRFTLPPDEILRTTPQLIEFVERTEDSGGFSLNLHTRWYNLYYRDKRDNRYLLPAVKAMAYFHIASIRKMLEYALEDITNLAATGDDILCEIRQLIEQIAPFVVEIRITNCGRSAALFTPWALLEVTHPNGATDDIKVELVRALTYWKPDDPVQAAKQQAELIKLPEIPIEQDKYFVVDAGHSVKMMYRSRLSINKLTAANSNFTDIMGLEILKCQIHLRRADIQNQKGSWIHSPLTTFGTRAELFPRNEIMAALNPKWFSKKWFSSKLR